MDEKIFNEIMGGMIALKEHKFYDSLVFDLENDFIYEEEFKKNVQSLMHSMGILEQYSNQWIKEINKDKQKFIFGDLYNIVDTCEMALKSVQFIINKMKPEQMLGASKKDYDDFKKKVADCYTNFRANSQKLIEFLDRPEVVDISEALYFSDAKFSTKNAKVDVVENDIFGEDGIKPEDVIQNKEGACFLLAPLASMAAKNPELIKNMIKDKGEHVEVTLYGYTEDKENPLKQKKVPFIVKVDKTVMSVNKDSANWVKLIEKAYAASGLSANFGNISTDPNKVQDGSIVIKDALDGGSPQAIISALSPFEADNDPKSEQSEVIASSSLKEAREKFCQKVFDANQNKGIIYLTTFDHVVSVKDVIKEGNKYSVVCYDQAEEDVNKREFTLDLGTVFDGASKFKQLYISGVDKGQITNNKIFDFKYISKAMDKTNVKVAPKAKAQGNAIVEDDNPSTIHKFDKYITKLEKAKTFFNSDEYTDLIDLVTLINKKDKLEKGKNLTDKQNYVVKLKAIKGQINKYLEHKAYDGVKQNAYDKLAAVEELNKYVSSQLGKLKLDSFTYDKKEIKAKGIEENYEHEVAAFNRKGNTKATPKQMTKQELDACMKRAKKFYPNALASDLKSTDDCMCRIILCAMDRNVEDKEIKKLQNARKDFCKNPARKVNTTPVKEAVNANPLAL